MITEKLVTNAYLYLKSYVYHDNLNLFLKQEVADFENNAFKREIKRITNLLNSDDIESSRFLKFWLRNIDVHLLPKKIDEEVTQDALGQFITNVRDVNVFSTSKVNYFIDAPIQLHIIEVLWSLVVGPLLDNKLTDDCYGNRLHNTSLHFISNEQKSNSSELFKRYIDQYNKWRDKAVNKATQLSEQDENVAILSLDLTSYFYHVDLDFDKIEELIIESIDEDEEHFELALTLTELLQKIFVTYNDYISKYIKTSHKDCIDKLTLPIGFTSSAIIANWYLKDFDEEVCLEAKPAYYGRYVDDILIVLKRPNFDKAAPIESLIERYCGGVLFASDQDEGYFIDVDSNELPIQKQKLIFQYFDKLHSKAGLKVFKQELDERSSAFRFLPSDHIDGSLDKFAYDILYDGSANKLRSIVGLAENETELSKYLSSHITAHRLCKIGREETVLPDLKIFFRGINAFQFSRLWEKVYLYAIVVKQYSFIKSFYNHLSKGIEKVKYFNPDSRKLDSELTLKLQSSLNIYNDLSLSIGVGLLDITDEEELSSFEGVFLSKHKKVLAELIFDNDLLYEAQNFRSSNLIRHNIVAWPLANYSGYKGDLTDDSAFVISHNFTVNTNKIKLSPRFIHFDEWQLFHLPIGLNSKESSLFSHQEKAADEYKKLYFSNSFPVEIVTPVVNSNNTVIASEIAIRDGQKNNKLKIALANLVVNAKDISSALRRDKVENVSLERQINVFKVINAAIAEKADVLVLPEVSIPVSWLPFMIAHARRHQLGIIFGLEHWVTNNGEAYNLLIEALPFKINSKYKSCLMTARLKNHYAPAESELIDTYRLFPANQHRKPNDYYHKVKWRGVSFASYNCFELSDITHRTLFKSELDILFACVWNKDTNYYQHILESSVRDIHCYVVQSNTAQYGGSCVLRPSKTVDKTMLYVKGGTNSCVLTVDLDIAALRDFQYKSKPDKSDKFKHLPPGFDHEKVMER